MAFSPNNNQSPRSTVPDESLIHPAFRSPTPANQTFYNPESDLESDIESGPTTLSRWRTLKDKIGATLLRIHDRIRLTSPSVIEIITERRTRGNVPPPTSPRPQLRQQSELEDNIELTILPHIPSPNMVQPRSPPQRPIRPEVYAQRARQQGREFARRFYVPGVQEMIHELNEEDADQQGNYSVRVSLGRTIGTGADRKDGSKMAGANSGRDPHSDGGSSASSINARPEAIQWRNFSRNG
jgi:hypothetical protein